MRRVTVSMYVYTCECRCALVCAYVYSCVWVCTHVCARECGPRMALALLCLPFCWFVVCLPVKITALTVHRELTNVYNTNDAWRPSRTANKYHKGDESHYLEQNAWMRLLSSSVHQHQFSSWKQFRFVLSPVHSVWLVHTMLLHLMFWSFSKVHFYLFILTYCPYLLNYYTRPHNWNHI